MSYHFEELLGGEFKGNAAATAEEVAAVERSLRRSLPDDFREFLQVSNGGDGFIGGHYIMLWTIEEIGEYNESYQVNEYAPGLLLFGSNCGGEGYAFDMRTSTPTIVMVPFVGMSLEYAKPVAATFGAFLKELGNEMARYTKTHRPNRQRFAGKEIYEIKPVIFGGSPPI